MNAHRCAAALAIGLFCSLPTPGETATIYLSRADWDAANVGFADIDLSGIPEFDTVDAIAGLPFGQGLGFDTDLQRLQVPDSWNLWSGGQEPAVLATINTFAATATFLAGPLTGGFGLEVQPDLFGVVPITLTLSDGTTTIVDVDGFGGALFIGWRGTDITSFTIGCLDCGFAFGRMAIAPDVQPPSAVAEPATLTLLGSALVLLALTARRARGRRVYAHSQ